MNASFLDLCEAVAARHGIPALQVATVGPAGTLAAAWGCGGDDRFRIASITKPLTASLALQVLDLEAATGLWPDDVRVRHLLSHTSGYDGELGDLARFGDGDDALGALAAELPRARRHLGVDIVWSYANTGYWLAGHLAAAAAGTTYEDALAERVLRPAGLEATGFGEPTVPGTGPGASGAPYPRARRPSGGLVSTAADVLRFAQWHLAEPAWAAMRSPRGRPVRGVYGLGLAGERVGGVEVWGHGGSYGGYESSLLLVPSVGAALVALTNSGRGGRALDELEDAWLESVLGVGRPVAATVAVSAAALAAVAGTYANSTLTATVAPGGAGLVVAVEAPAGRFEVTARPIGRSRFEVVGGDEHGDRFDFPRSGFARLGGRLAARVG